MYVLLFTQYFSQICIFEAYSNESIFVIHWKKKSCLNLCIDIVSFLMNRFLKTDLLFSYIKFYNFI